MIPSPPVDPKAPVDPVDALRLLVADLQALADRLALTEGSQHGNPESQEAAPRFVQLLKAARERVTGPRAVVMLLSEHAALKRRFLERLLGPLSTFPETLAECSPEAVGVPVRLEYAPTPERTAPTLEQPIPVIRLPISTLERGLAVIDTPAIETPAIEEAPVGDAEAVDNQGAVSLLHCAEQSNAWIFVLGADHAIGKTAQMMLRQLPEQAAGLEFVVEGAEALNTTARAAAREQLLQTLRENCGIAEPRLTLIASAATEGDEGSYWHGRFATFHSVMMLRGRERWLQATRVLIAAALNEVGAEIEQAFKHSGAGLRHARLRLGLKDVQGLRTRFDELGHLDGESAGGTAQASNSEGTGPAPYGPQVQPTSSERVGRSEPWVGHAGETAEVFLSEREARELLAAQALRPPRGLRAKITTLLSSARLPWGNKGRAMVTQFGPVPKTSSRPWGLLGGVWSLAFLIILLWIMWPRLAAEHESAAEWDLRQQSAAPAPKPAPAAPNPTQPSLVVPAEHAETERAGLGDMVPAASQNRPHAAIRTPLAKPMPRDVRAGAVPTRRHRGFLGIGRLWSWVRHPKANANRSPAPPTSQ